MSLTHSGVAGGADMKSLVNVVIIQISPANAFAMFTWDSEADAKAGDSAVHLYTPELIRIGVLAY